MNKTARRHHPFHFPSLPLLLHLYTGIHPPTNTQSSSSIIHIVLCIIHKSPIEHLGKLLGKEGLYSLRGRDSGREIERTRGIKSQDERILPLLCLSLLIYIMLRILCIWDWVSSEQRNALSFTLSHCWLAGCRVLRGENEMLYSPGRVSTRKDYHGRGTGGVKEVGSMMDIRGGRSAGNEGSSSLYSTLTYNRAIPL